MTNNDLDRLEQAKTFTERVGAIPRADRGDFDDNGNLVFVDDVLAIAHDADERVRTEREARETAERERDDYKKELELRTHQVITCGVFAHHSDVSKVKDKKCYAETWATAQSRDVLKLREERDALAQQVEALTAENKTLRVMLPPLHNKIAELKQDAAILQEDIDELHTLLNDLNAERGSMKEVCDRWQQCGETLMKFLPPTGDPLTRETLPDVLWQRIPEIIRKERLDKRQAESALTTAQQDAARLRQIHTNVVAVADAWEREAVALRLNGSPNAALELMAHVQCLRAALTAPADPTGGQ